MATTMDGYIRVSRKMGREGEAYISPRVQEEAIRRWAEYKGIEIGAWHVDEDWSGGTHERPGLEAAIQRSLAGDTDGIVSWKIDRFSRHTENGLRDLRRLEAKDARLAFVAEDIDTSGPMGKFVYTIMLAMGEYFLDNIKAGWIVAKSRAMDRDVKIGPTPFGYERLEDGTLAPHPIHAGIVREAFTLAAERDLGAAVDYLSEQGVTHESGKRAGRERSWTTSTVRRLLQNRTYLGENTYGDRVERDAHEPLVSRAVWEAAQPGDVKRRRAAKHYPLSGVARCNSCGEPMVGASSGRPGGGVLRTYRCRASLRSWKGEQCPAPATMTADVLEGYVREQLLEAASVNFTPAVDTATLDAAESALQEAERELDDFLADTTGAASLRRLGRYDDALSARVAAVDRAQEDYRRESSQAAQAAVSVSPEMVGQTIATSEGLGEYARATLGGVVVTRGRGPVDTRVAIFTARQPTDAGVVAS